MRVSIKSARQVIAQAIVGEELVEFSCGSYIWNLRLSNDLWIIAQNIDSPLTESVLERLADVDSTLLDRSEPRYTALAALVANALNRPIVDVGLTVDAELAIHFEGGWRLDLESDVEIVDWQWSIGPSPKVPYVAPSFLLCCLWRGEVEAPNAETSGTS